MSVCLARLASFVIVPRAATCIIPRLLPLCSSPTKRALAKQVERPPCSSGLENRPMRLGVSMELLGDVVPLRRCNPESYPTFPWNISIMFRPVVGFVVGANCPQQGITVTVRVQRTVITAATAPRNAQLHPWP
jgi:hypothetical protein